MAVGEKVVANAKELLFPYAYNLLTIDAASLVFFVMVMFCGALLLLSLWFSNRREQDDLFYKFVQQQRKHLSELRGPLSSLWDELAPPPFRNDAEFEDLLFTTEEVRQGDVKVSHFCFLVHGHRGTSRDLGYVQAAMRRTASVHSGNGSRLVLHSVSCNERKTDDGVRAGGERLVEEMLAIIRERMESCTQEKNREGLREVTVSLLGNSLGGLYSRYALSVLQQKCRESCQQPSPTVPGTLYLDGKYAVHLNIFCTTATPHLGVASHTFLPLPRRAEVGVAHAMGQSGKDLFRLNALLRNMATEEQFLSPLSAFRKRTAYANAYSTDFPVPACTAAFLHTNNMYPHFFLETCETSITPPPSSDEEDEEEEEEEPKERSAKKPKCSLVIATLLTPSRQESDLAEDCLAALELEGKNGDLDAQLAHMSASLDSLGWKKVFVDMRKEVPRIVVPKSILRRPSGSNSDSDDTSSTGSDASEPIIDVLKGRDVVSSKDLVAAVTETGEMGVYWPLGHNMMVAFSRSRWSTYMNRAGRPVVDTLAREIVNDILSWSPPAELLESKKRQ